MRHLLLLPFLAACSTVETVPVNLKAERPEWFVCNKAERPTIPAEHTIDWRSVTSVSQAQSEHEAYVASIRTREGAVAGYVVDLEGKLFTCWNNMRAQSDYYDGL